MMRNLGDENPFDREATTVNMGGQDNPRWVQAAPGLHWCWNKGYEQGVHLMSLIERTRISGGSSR